MAGNKTPPKVKGNAKLGPNGHRYAMNFYEPELLVVESPPQAARSAYIPAPIATHPPKPNPSGQIFKSIGHGVQRITNSAELVAKGRPVVEYRLNGWTTINNPLANRFASAAIQRVVAKPKPKPKPILYYYRDRVPPPTDYDDIDLKDHTYDAEEPDEVEDGEVIKGQSKIGSHIKMAQELALAIPEIDPRTVITGVSETSLGSIDGLDLSAIMKKEKTKFSKFQEKAMACWILRNKTHLVYNQKPAFEILLKELGFNQQGMKKHLLVALRIKVRGRLQSIGNAMFKTEAMREWRNEEGAIDIAFAGWTADWNAKVWDGDTTGPEMVTIKAFESGFN